MPTFTVKCCDADGLWDGIEPREIEAEDSLQAAERACGCSRLTNKGGKPGQLRAEVWLKGSRKQRYPEMFYESPDRP